MLRTHHVVCATVCLPRDHRNLLHSSLAVSIQELRIVFHDPSPLLSGSRQESRYILEHDQGDVEGITEASEPRGFQGCIDLEHAGKNGSLIFHDSYRPA